MAGKQGYGRSPELSLKSIYIFSSTFEGSSHLERPERRFFRNLHFWVGAPSPRRSTPAVPGHQGHVKNSLLGRSGEVQEGPGTIPNILENNVDFFTFFYIFDDFRMSVFARNIK